jgi:alpha-mannosidase
MRSPGIEPPTNGRPSGYTDQANQDWGHHEFTFGLAGHDGDWRAGQTDWQAYRLNDPLMAFQATGHKGSLGKRFSLVNLSNSRVKVLALKKAEGSDEIVLRLVELDGKAAQDVLVAFAGPVAAAREINAQEQPIGTADVVDGKLKVTFSPYQPRTFALRLNPAASKVAVVTSQPVAIKYDLAVASNDDTKTSGGGMDGAGEAMPAEMLPGKIQYNGVDFDLAAAKTGSANALVANGQMITLPEGHFNKVYVLAAATGGDQSAVFRVGSNNTNLNVQDWTGFIGQWDTRLWKNGQERDWAISANHAAWPPADLQQREQRPVAPRYPEDYAGLKPGYIKPAELAWYASHVHTADGLNEPYQYSYVFAYPIEVAGNAKTLTLPKNDKIRILAISVANENPELKPVEAMFDSLEDKKAGR